MIAVSYLQPVSILAGVTQKGLFFIRQIKLNFYVTALKTNKFSMATIPVKIANANNFLVDTRTQQHYKYFMTLQPQRADILAEFLSAFKLDKILNEILYGSVSFNFTRTIQQKFTTTRGPALNPSPRIYEEII